MSFVVVYDACVLYPPPLRDLLVRVARTGVVQARWSERILDECTRSIATNRPDIPGEALMRMRTLLQLALPGATVTGYESLVEEIELPDPADRHVLAVAIAARASAIVTFNLADFPRAAAAA